MKNSINRRSVLKSAGALVGASAVVVAGQSLAGEVEQDAELRSLFADFKKAEEIYHLAAKAPDFLAKTEEEIQRQSSLEKEMDAAWEVYDNIAHAIRQTPSQGLVGIQIKLEVWRWSDEYREDACAEGALEDARRINGDNAIHLKPSIEAFVPTTHANPGDKALIDTYAEWISIWEGDLGETDEEITAECKRCNELERLMIATKADTLAGILVKEKWLEYETNFAGESECPNSVPMFQSLMADVKRIGGHHV